MRVLTFTATPPPTPPPGALPPPRAVWLLVGDGPGCARHAPPPPPAGWLSAGSRPALCGVSWPTGKVMASPTTIREWSRLLVHRGPKRSENYEDEDKNSAWLIATCLNDCKSFSDLNETLAQEFASPGPIREFLERHPPPTSRFEKRSLACVKLCIAHLLRHVCSRAEEHEDDGGWTCPELELCKLRLTSALLDKPAFYTGSCEKIANRFIKRGGAPVAAVQAAAPVADAPAAPVADAPAAPVADAPAEAVEAVEEDEEEEDDDDDEEEEEDVVEVPASASSSAKRPRTQEASPVAAPVADAGDAASPSSAKRPRT